MTGFKICTPCLCRESAVGASRYRATKYDPPRAADGTASNRLVNSDGFSRDRESFLDVSGWFAINKSGTAEFLRLFRVVVTQFLRANAKEIFCLEGFYEKYE